jgi:polygalacturonase
MPRFPRIWAALLVLSWASAAGAATYNVRDYGAKADKTTNDGPALQAAMDACNRDGGGEVVVPSGNYLIGHVDLKSNVALILQDGATLWASSRWEDYEKSAHGRLDTYLISADGQENVTLAGDGEIHGLGEADLDRRVDGGAEDSIRTLPHRYGTIQLNQCRNVHIRDVRIRYSERFTIYMSRCERVFIDGVSILNNFWRTNTDGIDPSSCKDVFISNCYIVAGDDCICPKTSGGIPLENLVVTNCVLQSVSTAFKLGTGSSGDFRDIKVSNCVIRNSGVGIGFFIKDGGTAERLSFENISIETTTLATEINHQLRNTVIPIYIDIEARTDQSRVGAVRDVSFSDIQVTSANSILIQGTARSLIQNLTLRNLTFRVPEGFDFSARKKRSGGTGNPNDERITKFVRQPTYIALANIDGLVVDDVRVLVKDDVFQRFDRSALAVFNSKDGVITNVERRPGAVPGGQPVVALTDCQDVRVSPAEAAPNPAP